MNIGRRKRRMQSWHLTGRSNSKITSSSQMLLGFEVKISDARWQ
jgi:hypothetical protein